MKGRDILELVRLVKFRIYDETGYDVLLRDDESKFYGNTDDYVYYCEPKIGIKDFKGHPDVDFPLEFVAMPVVNMCHEVYGHCTQVDKQFERASPMNRVLALSHYACQSSAHYYGTYGDGRVYDRYFKHPHEIASQYAGIRMADRFLTEIYDQDTANDMLCSYVNYRVSKDSEFVSPDKPYVSVSDILDDFDKAFRKCALAHREYDYNKDYGPGYASELCLYAKERQDPKYVSRMEHCQNGMKQDWIAASIYLARNDHNHLIRSKPVFSGMDMDPDRAVAVMKKPVKPMPSRQELLLRNIDSELQRIYENSEQEPEPDEEGPDYL